MPNQHRRSKDEELDVAAGFEVHTLAVFFNDRLAHAQLLLPIVVRVNYPGRPATTILAGGGGGCLGGQRSFSVLS